MPNRRPQIQGQGESGHGPPSCCPVPEEGALEYPPRRGRAPPIADPPPRYEPSLTHKKSELEERSCRPPQMLLLVVPFDRTNCSKIWPMAAKEVNCGDDHRRDNEDTLKIRLVTTDYPLVWGEMRS